MELIIDKEGRVFPIDIGPRSGGNMIPDLLSMIFRCDLVEMSIRVAMGQNVNNNVNEGIENNEVAIHLYEKCGFVREGIKRESNYKNGRYTSMIMMSILKKEWNQK